MDYIIPEFLAKALRKPSERTQMESSLIGILVMMLGSLCVTSYLVINGVVTGWLRFFTIVSELGILSFQWSLLSATYSTYYQYKLEKGMYPEDYNLKIKIEEGKRLSEDLKALISKLNSNRTERRS